MKKQIITTKIRKLLISISLTIAIIFSLLSMATSVSADRVIDNIEGIYIEDFVAGSTAQANFSYSYLRDRPENPDDSPLIFRINITSSDDENFPVWKGDFEVSGFIKRYILFGLIPVGEEHFTCNEQEPQTIIHPLGNETVNVKNGTFYCFDPEGNLDFGDFNAYDEVFLNIKSHPALWPGEYGLSVELYYLTDTYSPIVNILDKFYFDRYFRDGSYVDFEVEIIDVNLNDYWAKIITPNKNFSFAKQEKQGYENIYEFFQTIPNDIIEGDFEVLVTAVDDFGNNATDNITIKIDLTPPTIELLSPEEGKVYSEILPIELNITDEKSGVNKTSVKFRLREIANGTICPETGVPIGNYSCVNTGWLNIEFDEITETFTKQLNTTEYNLSSGEYWFDARAEDILGNLAYLE